MDGIEISVQIAFLFCYISQTPSLRRGPALPCPACWKIVGARALLPFHRHHGPWPCSVAETPPRVNITSNSCTTIIPLLRMDLQILCNSTLSLSFSHSLYRFHSHRHLRIPNLGLRTMPSPHRNMIFTNATTTDAVPQPRTSPVPTHQVTVHDRRRGVVHQFLVPEVTLTQRLLS